MFLFFHSLHIKQKSDHMEKIRWKVKRKNGDAENMSYENVSSLILERDSHIPFVQGKEGKATLERKGITSITPQIRQK